MKDFIEISDIKLSEISGTKYKCIIIKSGITGTANAFAEINGSKIPIYKDYKEETLINAVNNGLFENVPALYRSEDEHLQGFNTGIDNYIGTFTNVKWNDELKQVEGVLNLKTGGALAQKFKKTIVNTGDNNIMLIL